MITRITAFLGTLGLLLLVFSLQTAQAVCPTTPTDCPTPVYKWVTLSGNATQPLQAVPLQQLQQEVNSNTICNVNDQIASDGDVAPAFLRCLATGQPNILFPPATYTIKSLTTPVGIVLAPVAFPLSHVSNVHIEATGATFVMQNAITTGSWHIFMAYLDSKNDSWNGGTFQLNPAASTGSPGLVNALCWNSATNLQITNTVLFANGTTASAFCGTWGFENRVANNWAYGFRFGFDTAYEEDLLVDNNFINGTGSPLPMLGYSVSSVPANYCTRTPTNTCTGSLIGQHASTWPDGSYRNLSNGQTNGLRVMRNTFASAATGVKLQDVNGALVDGNTITGPIPAQTTGSNNGVLINTDVNTHNEGFITQGAIVTNNTVTGMGDSVTPALSGGVLLADGTYGLANINIINNAIFDNCGEGIGPNGIGHTTGVTIVGNDFRTRGGACAQTPNVDAAMMAALGYNNLQSGANSDASANNPVADLLAAGATPAGGYPRLAFQAGAITIYSTDATGADRIMLTLPYDNSTASVQFRVPARTEQPLTIGGGVTGGLGAITITPGAAGTDPVTFTPVSSGGSEFDGRVLMPTLPTSCSGIPTGGLRNNAGVLNICP